VVQPAPPGDRLAWAPGGLVSNATFGLSDDAVPGSAEQPASTAANTTTAAMTTIPRRDSASFILLALVLATHVAEIICTNARKPSRETRCTRPTVLKRTSIHSGRH
jgi:hypothetical protein